VVEDETELTRLTLFTDGRNPAIAFGSLIKDYCADLPEIIKSR
jgi:hypothetical protein